MSAPNPQYGGPEYSGPEYGGPQYGGPQYGGPQYGGGYPTPQTQSNGLAIAGLVCGIVGILIFNFILGPLAIIFGSIGLSRANRGAPRKTMAGWALGLGIFDVALWIILLIVVSNNGGLVV